MQRKAVVLLSGSVDSTLCLHLAKSQGYDVCALSLDVAGQHFDHEVAHRAAQMVGVSSHEIIVANQCASFANELQHSLVHYVNLLSLAAGYAQTLGAQDVFIGLRPKQQLSADTIMQWLQSYQELINLTVSKGLRIQTPLLFMTDEKCSQTAESLGLNLTSLVESA